MNAKTVCQKDNEEILVRILPKNYQYYIYGVSVREYAEISSEIKVDAHFRVNVKTEEEFEKFLEDFSRCSGTSWNKKNRMDRKGKNSKVSGIRKCIHNVRSNKPETASEITENTKMTGKCRELGKNTNCPADLTFKISEQCDSICSDKIITTHFLKKNFHYNHNHAIVAADALRYRPVSEETKKLFTALFDEDVSPSSAYRKLLDNFDKDVEGEETADQFRVPDYKWVFN